MLSYERASIYIETTIPSFLTARPSNSVIIAGRQQVTRQWWEERKECYRLFVSQYVLDEVLDGNPEAAQKRVDILDGIDVLEIDDEVILLTQTILDAGALPPKAGTDAGHIAVAARHGIDFLMTWNCRHIANAELLRRINYIVSEEGILPAHRMYT